MSTHRPAPPTPESVPETSCETAPGGPAIDVTDLGYRYARGGGPALTGLTLTLRPGTVTGLLGRNGSGKTTLLKILAGVLADYDGRVRIAGHHPGPESKTLVSFLPDASFLAPGPPASAAIAQHRRLFADFGTSSSCTSSTCPPNVP